MFLDDPPRQPPDDLRSVASGGRRSTCGFLLSLCLLLIVSLSGCAGFHPPADLPNEEQSELQIAPVRADADTLHLEVRASQVTPEAELRIWRRDAGGEWNRVQTLAVDERLADALVEHRAEWHDEPGPVSRTLEYRIEIVGEEHLRTSPVTTVEWLEPPATSPPTAEPYISENGPPETHLMWSADSGIDVQIERRDVLADSPFVAVAVVDSAADEAFDGDVEPGGVYAYRIRFVDRRSAYPRYSFWSEEIYVSLPE